MTEVKNRLFWGFVLRAVCVFCLLFVPIVLVNYVVDASEVIRPKWSINMAELSLKGNVVATPLNYNDRLYQYTIINESKQMPNTIVIGSSRGMYLGNEITGYSLYNNCVSGACIEDYYALLGLYYQKYRDIPPRIIIETSPWIFNKNNPETRWMEQKKYKEAAESFYYMINGQSIDESLKRENPFLSLSYFRYNYEELLRNGMSICNTSVHISEDVTEAAELLDGSVRYETLREEPSEERMALVKNCSRGPVVYENADHMREMDIQQIHEYEKLLDYLKDYGVEIIIYMSPFSATQCFYIFDEGTNTVFSDVEAYLVELGEQTGIRVIGGYDARRFDITDEYFFDNIHLDKKGTQLVWNSGD